MNYYCERCKKPAEKITLKYFDNSVGYICQNERCKHASDTALTKKPKKRWRVRKRR
jgi:hypothetical protein